MLHLVQFEHVYSAPDIIRRTPLADMSFQAQAGRLSCAVNRLEHVYRLRAFIA